MKAPGLFRVILPLLMFASLAASPAQAGTTLWTVKSTQEVRWHKVTDAGTLLVGTDDALTCYDPETGKVLWQRADIKKALAFQIEEITGTPILLVSDYQGAQKTKLYALDIQTGENFWESDRLKGASLDVIPLLQKDVVLLLTARDARATKDKPDITAFQITTGTVLWEAEFPDKVDFHLMEGGKTGGFSSFGSSNRFDLSGHQPPVVDGNDIYFTYAGLHRFDLATGKLVWKVAYDVTEGKLKRGNAQLVIDGDIVYTSAKGQIRALDKATGQMKWMSKDFGAAVAEMLVSGKNVFGRLGGSFYDWEEKEWTLKKPLGVVALSRETGNLVWKYDDAKDSITNMVLLPEQNSILIADAQHLIGLDTTAEGKVKEAFRTKLEFKFKIGAGAKAGRTALKFAQGGVFGMMKKDKSDLDMPVAILQRENGLAVVRGKQHLLAFDPKSKGIPWSLTYEAPSVPGWQKWVMFAIQAANYGYNLRGASDTQLGSFDNTRYNAQKAQAIEDYRKFAERRYSAAVATGRYVYILTNIGEGKEGGVGIIGVNLDTGASDREVILRDKEPDYEVDEIFGRVFHIKEKKEIIAYNLK